MIDEDIGPYLRRYTDLPALIHLLRSRTLTFLDPQSWDDKNDSHYLRLYRRQKHLKSVLAVCFTRTSERYHHWRVFAHGSSGVCIRFSSSKLLTALAKQPNLRTGKVSYKHYDQMKRRRPKIAELPFLKRYAFQDEREYRILYESDDNIRKLNIPIPLSCIDRIKLNPWIDKDMYDDVEQTIRSIGGCRNMRVARSSLTSSEKWQRFGETAK